MSGFDKDWLALREPADKAARDAALVADLAAYLADRDNPSVLDIGCGTGSTFRSLSPSVPAGTSWQLLDYDPLLLQEAGRRIGTGQAVRFRQHDLNDLDSLPLDGVSVITASALFDLCSDAFCRRFVAHVAARGCAFYAALNYDGVIRWNKPHPLDAAALESFNRHQQTDKGFGPALGPHATACLSEALEEHGYRVQVGDSPWQLRVDQPDLQRAFLEGMRQPLMEIGLLSPSEIETWLEDRLAEIAGGKSEVEVGHSDILALHR